MTLASASVQFQVDGVDTGPPDTTAPYALAWDSRTVPNGAHALTARATDAAGNSKLSASVTVNVANTSSFQNEILATGFDLPTAIKFLPDGRMLVVELAGHDQGAAAAVHDPGPDAVPADHQHRRQPACSRGSSTSRSTPTSATNHYYYVFYTLGSAEPRPALALHRQRAADRHGAGQRVRALPGPAGRQRRAPRRRDQLRQRRQDLLHDRRALRRGRGSRT